MPRNTNCADDLASFMLSIRDVEHGTVLPKSSLSTTCELSSNCSENFESSAFNDVVTNLCESMSEVNAVKYVAGYVIKSVLNSHKCVECSQFLLNSESVPESSADVFFHFKLFEHCNMSSLHVPSDVAVHIFAECRHVFAQNVEKLLCGKHVCHHLCELSRARLKDENLYTATSFVTNTVDTCVALFIRVLLYHRIKVINSEFVKGKQGEKPKKRNRKAMKIHYN